MPLCTEQSNNCTAGCNFFINCVWSQSVSKVWHKTVKLISAFPEFSGLNANNMHKAAFGWGSAIQPDFSWQPCPGSKAGETLLSFEAGSILLFEWVNNVTYRTDYVNTIQWHKGIKIRNTNMQAFKFILWCFSYVTTNENLPGATHWAGRLSSDLEEIGEDGQSETLYRRFKIWCREFSVGGWYEL